MHTAPRATVEIPTGEGLQLVHLLPEETFYLTRKVIAQGNPDLKRYISRRPNCPQVVYVAGHWTLLNDSRTRRLRITLARGGYEEVGPGVSIRLKPGRTVLYFGPHGEIEVGIVIDPAVEPEEEEGEARSGTVTYRGPEPTAQVERTLVQQSSRSVLVAVLAPWLSADPALQDLKDRAVAARCAGYSVGYVDKVLKEVRAGLWPDSAVRPSRADLAEYFLTRGLLGAADMLSLRHVACGHRRPR
ncbi:hypothetical protein [Streptomyces sp. NPDC088785]|uniref:hypothetical protein n=1 Tax=Streptomyces sp. NPDC088785 TaxID=3365897 RepID=UPI00380122FB